jgi:hypothetical protein
MHVITYDAQWAVPGRRSSEQLYACTVCVTQQLMAVNVDVRCGADAESTHVETLRNRFPRLVEPTLLQGLQADSDCCITRLAT